MGPLGGFLEEFLGHFERISRESPENSQRISMEFLENFYGILERF